MTNAVECARDRARRMKKQIKALLHKAVTTPIINVTLITPEGFVDFVMGLHHPQHGGYLGKFAYQTNCVDCEVSVLNNGAKMDQKKR